jgi:putative transposase
LLRNLEIVRSNQAWMIDITYLRMRGGFMYLVALIDVHSRYIVSWSLSNSMETGFCIDALKKGLLYAQPEIINSDQGSQFTSEDWVDYLDEWNIEISMTGKGRCLGRVGNWRAHPYNHVSSPRSSNRTCATNASGFRSKYHAFAFALDTSAIVCAIL